MIVFVDYEHESARTEDWFQRNQAARTWITYRLEDLSGHPCMLVRYNRITAELLTRLDAKAIFISGNGSDPALYDQAEVAPFEGLMQNTELPVFGFCGGFQFFSAALGAPVVPLDVDPQDLTSKGLIMTPSGKPFEFGYHPVELTNTHPLLEGLGDQPIFRHAHGLHVPNPPPGFEVVATTAATPVQMAINEDRRMVGTQFHPEYWTDEHPAGKTLIGNFLTWANI